MDEYSRLGGASEVSRVSDRVWGVEKKARTADRDRRERKKDKREADVKSDGQGQEAVAAQGEPAAEEGKAVEEEEGIAYGSSKPMKRHSRKIDLVM